MPGTWQPLTNQPSFQACTMLLLTDGSVFCNAYYTSADCWRLRPDEFGSYINGGWNKLAPMDGARLFFASAVLADGRVLVSGGEYFNGVKSETTDTQVYDPMLNHWNSVAPPTGWDRVGDAPCCVLNDGRVIIGSNDTRKTAIFDPTTNSFTAGPDKLDTTSEEETWTLLKDGTVLVVECDDHPKAEKYDPVSNAWVSAGTLPVDLVQPGNDEIGPAVLLPDGRAFCTGATGATALYTPGAMPTDPGTWSAGPNFPDDGTGNSLQAKDAPACLLPNGRVLCAVGPASSGGYGSPTSFVEYDPLANQFLAVPLSANSGGFPYDHRMLLLPNGQVLLSASTTSDIEVYTPDGDPDEDWRPHITDCPRYLRNKQTYAIRGRRFNGLSQAVSYGDDATMATNYPLVRLRSEVNGHEYYCRTFDHSTMAVATGPAIVSTSFKVPFDVPHGKADLVVIANGIASESVDVKIGPWLIHFPVTEGLVNRLIGSLADGPLWVLGPNGPIPVDPGWTEIAKEAKSAWKQIESGVRTLAELGETAQVRQLSEVPTKAKPMAKESKPRRAHGARSRRLPKT
jgi:hypothetical protein